MKEVLRRLVAAGTMLAILLILVITASYAWLTFSTAPEVLGIQISLGGGGTILLAPDQTRVTDGGVYHYPGRFARTLYFNQWEQYGYLNTLTGLSPVSTADGLHWYLPSYYTAFDEAVIRGDAVVGGLKPVESFGTDVGMAHANLTDPDDAVEGHYVYLDFWAVSPSKDYNLRIAQGEDAAGSFVIDLMTPTENGEGGYELTQPSSSLAASVRVGFLVNHDTITDGTIDYYATTSAYSSSYTSLRGAYQEKGENILYSAGYRFTIYEPNADYHPKGENGTYIATRPLGWDGGRVVLSDVRDRLTVQLKSKWSEGVHSSYYIEEAFGAASYGEDYGSSAEAERDFYGEYLQGNLSAYVDKAPFITGTSSLYDAMTDGVVSAQALSALDASGATVDVVVASLEKNIPQRIRMFVWIEGQDVDCEPLTGNVTIALGIELAGSQINEKSKQENG